MTVLAATILALALLTAACEADPEIEPRARPTTPPKVVMPVTFPDGSTAEILYPPDVDLAGMRAQPSSSGQLRDCCARDFFVFSGAVQGELAGDAPLKTYRSADGSPVEYWRVGAAGHDPRTDRWLIFSFGKWNVLVSDDDNGMTDDQLATWARSLRGEETSDGFLRLRAEPPLQLAKAGEHSGPELLFSDSRKSERKMVRFLVGECQPDPEEDGKLHGIGGETGPEADWFASRCFADQSISMHVQTSDKPFARQVMNRVEARNVQLGS